MSEVVLKIENVSKQYRLGLVGTGTLNHDLKRWWHLIRGKEDPFLKIGGINDREKSGGEYVWALNDISFSVKKGEIIGIIGKNGAGKSTLLKLLSQVTTPTTGLIKVKGRIAALLEVGTGFHPELTGRENIYLNGAILGMTKEEISSKIDEIIDFSGVSKYIDTPVKRYSSGMMVRLGFAVAAHLEPEILVVDEVLAVGDVEFQKKCLGKMKDVAGEGRTVLFVSHNMGAIKALCDKGIMLDKGRCVFEGGIDDVIDFYLDSNSDTSEDGKLTTKNRFGTGEARIQSIQVLDAEGVAVNQLFFKQKVTIGFTIEVNEPIKNLLFWIRVQDILGDDVMLIESSDDIFTFINLEKGIAKYEVQLKEYLIPREYYLSIAVYKDDGMAIDVVEKALKFKVLKESEKGGDYYRWGKSFGYVYSDSKWNKISKIEKE